MTNSGYPVGGYHGRLGETVGQHWHNIQYVRKYVIPHDPKTPDQLANRNSFKLSTLLAQWAMNIDEHGVNWKYGKKSEFQNRVSVTRKRLIAGLDITQAFPNFPDNFHSKNYIMGVTATFDTMEETVLIKCASPVMEETRYFDCSIRGYNTITNIWTTLVSGKRVDTGNTLSFNAPWNTEIIYPWQSIVYADTNDDHLHPGNHIRLVETPILAPDQPIPSTTPIDRNVKLLLKEEGLQ
jgi:hypothetical protein